MKRDYDQCLCGHDRDNHAVCECEFGQDYNDPNCDGACTVQKCECEAFKLER